MSILFYYALSVSGVQSAAVNVICELARKNPKNYLSLSPIFFKLMTTSSNNWVLIKIIKLVSIFVVILSSFYYHCLNVWFNSLKVSINWWKPISHLTLLLWSQTIPVHIRQLIKSTTHLMSIYVTKSLDYKNLNSPDYFSQIMDLRFFS